ncbi:hypothetical protein ACWGR4_24915 [Embleya sp. NPDC055664]|uniref:hypothetical protein n=1 Tax=Embleya sp. NPDC059237 TaxID=3346784 RepID=UPI0036B8F4B8
MDEHQRQPEAEPEWLDNDDFERLLAEVLPELEPALPPGRGKRIHERAAHGDSAAG